MSDSHSLSDLQPKTDHFVTTLTCRHNSALTNIIPSNLAITFNPILLLVNLYSNTFPLQNLHNRTFKLFLKTLLDKNILGTY